MAKKDVVTYRTPRGIAVYPRLDTPDTKFNEHGTYKADLRLSGKDAKDMIAMIQGLAVELLGEELPVSDTIIKKKGKFRPNEDNNCFQPDFDPETGKLTGDWNFFFRVKNHMVKDKKSGEQRLWDRKPAVFTAGGKLVTKRVRIGAGTEYAVTFEAYKGKISTGEPYIALQPHAVQVYKLVEFVPGNSIDAAALGIEQADGWEPEEDEEDSVGTDNGTTEDSSSNEDQGEAPRAGEDDF
ncbi:MAG: hypothetical protein ACTHJ3_00695 [Pararhizobium sp.]